MNKEIYHISLASHNEVIFRDREDLIKSFNVLAAACCSTDSRLIAYAFLTTHIHCAVQTSEPELLFKKYRYSYTRYFNAKYHRKGTLGDTPFFDIFKGLRHMTIGISYILRQGLHHGISSTAFGYPFCSINAYFSKDLGRTSTKVTIADNQRYKTLRRDSSIPNSWRMDEEGMLHEEDVIDTSFVEMLFLSPRNYLYYMNRITDQSIIEEQLKDDESAPITLERIEYSMPDNVSKILEQNEKGRIDYRIMSDIELCHIIDNCYLNSLNVKSIYELSDVQRFKLKETIFQKFQFNPNNPNNKYITNKQLKRCIVI